MEDMEQRNKVRKIISLLKHYQKEGTEIVIVNTNNKKLDISGSIDTLKTVTFFGMQPHVVIGGMKLFLEDLDVNEIYPADTKLKDVEEKDIPGRKSIPKSLKFEVWERYFGQRLRGKCLCCKSTDIARDDCEMCHIISVASGGETNIDNLKPGCKNCNRSMGTMDFEEYRRKYH